MAICITNFGFSLMFGDVTALQTRNHTFSFLKATTQNQILDNKKITEGKQKFLKICVARRRYLAMR